MNPHLTQWLSSKWLSSKVQSDHLPWLPLSPVYYFPTARTTLVRPVFFLFLESPVMTLPQGLCTGGCLSLPHFTTTSPLSSLYLEATYSKRPPFTILCNSVTCSSPKFDPLIPFTMLCSFYFPWHHSFSNYYMISLFTMFLFCLLLLESEPCEGRHLCLDHAYTLE